MAAWLIRLVEIALPPGLGEAVAGDLAEEWAAGASFSWLLRQSMAAVWRGSGVPMVSVAAAVLVLAAAFELRRFALTLIPFRERADMGVVGLMLLVVLAAAVTGALVLSQRGVAWPFALGCAFLPFLLGVPMSAGQTIVWALAPLSGGALALHLRKKFLR